LPCGCQHTQLHSQTFTTADRLDQLEIRQAVLVFLDNLDGIIRTAIFHHDHLVRIILHAQEAIDLIERSRQAMPLVIRRDDDGQECFWHSDLFLYQEKTDRSYAPGG